jgi:Domain of unknown function (DUF4874)/Domain of unknown function (DUF4832)
MTRLAALILSLILLSLGTAHADQRTIKFAPTETEFPNPERGWWTFGPALVDAGSDWNIKNAAKNGHRVLLAIIRLDDYRDKPIPADYLKKLSDNFDTARKYGVKLMIRAAYNYPGSDAEQKAARDAPLSVVLGHIKQLGPIITANADTIVVMQAGFIGMWGESHSSQNDLTTPSNKRTIRDAIYAAVPKSLPVVWRYPRDIMSWTDDTRSGFHNDCFLSSKTDVGTYSGDEKIGATERAEMEKRTASTFFGGETCNVGSSTARYDCSAILAEGARFHLSALNSGYYTRFHDGWKSQGCFDEVTRRMGYRLELAGARIGAQGTIALDVKNTGWAAPIQARPVVVTTYLRGKLRATATLTGTLDTAKAGTTITLTGILPGIAKADRICFSAPDTSARLAKTAEYAIRFANADTNAQAWDPTLAAFCLNGIKRR